MATWLLMLLVAAMISHCNFAHSTVSASHALLLNDATFMDKVKEKDTLWLVKFCVPWCKYCLSADMVWEELGSALDMEDSVEIGEVDCTTSKATCSEVGIRSYPTIKLFYNGEEYKKYTGLFDLLSPLPTSDALRAATIRLLLSPSCPLSYGFAACCSPSAPLFIDCTFYTRTFHSLLLVTANCWKVRRHSGKSLEFPTLLDITLLSTEIALFDLLKSSLDTLIHNI
ncbi:hypothetical protein GOP47_0019433 [Adiantum capillus-veneris]|uniref:Thioredoxin domain-containing protein n=1 Tax=Adiantum capillus-veneris TaxID=13818 RepID=A0A9D4UB11_ADICA|nr:hypothetical protein GOP47_0019433 [Adiantum capillus-veneris]